MKVALYHPWIYLKGGLERTILEIGRRSRHDWTIYTSHFDAEGTFPEMSSLRIQEVERVSVRRSFGAVFDAALRISRTKLDLDGSEALLVCCDGVGSFITIRNNKLPIANLCFTPLRAVYDREYRMRHLSRQGWRRWAALTVERIYRVVDRWLWRRYRHVVFISKTVQARVRSGGLLAGQGQDIFYPGIDTAAAIASNTFDDFLFIPGRIMWTKNIQLGIEAFLQFRRVSGRPFRLVVAGMLDAKSHDYLAYLRGLAGEGNGVEFHVMPTDAEMRGYYERCSATLFTAFNEELGLTMMEAMACAKPVIGVNQGGPTEIVEHQVTGFLVNPDPNSFAVAIDALLSDPDRLRRMGAAGLARVQQFGWDHFVAQIDDLLDRLVAD